MSGREVTSLPSLSTSIVLFKPNVDALRATFTSLRQALEAARASRLIALASVILVDNDGLEHAALDAAMAEAFGRTSWLDTVVIRGQGNVGYGAGHDLALERSTAEFHLVLNPDVVLDQLAIGEAVKYLESCPSAGMVTPHVRNEAGDREYLCKRYPSVLTLALRGFAPRWLQRPFRPMLDHYEMRDLPGEVVAPSVPIASGCFMLTRTKLLRAIGGFSPAYFLYFEDFDLSLRFRALADIAYVPQVRIVHSGGYAARKGWTHRRFFIRSALTFFKRHGWKLW